MIDIVNSLPSGAQKQIAKKVGTSKEYVSRVLSKDKAYSKKAIMIVEEAIRIVSMEFYNKKKDYLTKKYIANERQKI